MIINVKIDDGAYMPTKAHETDAGFDLYTPIDFYVPPMGSVAIDCGVHVEIPENHVGMLKSKSGLMTKSNITCEGVIDCGYTGSIVCKLFNRDDHLKAFNRGDKITQLVVIPIPSVELVEVENLEKTERGDNGFGSSGR